MQELLGRITALDPEASHSLRVVACFDELMTGGVGQRGLLSAAAALAGRPVGFRWNAAGKTQLVGPDGTQLPFSEPTENKIENAELTVWIDHDGPATVNDKVILERLSLALHLRLNGFTDPEKRDLAKLLDASYTDSDRTNVATKLGLRTADKYRVVVAPLFAHWAKHPSGIEDVIGTQFGPVHVVVCDSASEFEGSPVGASEATSLLGLCRAFQTALVCLRLVTASHPQVGAEDLGGLAEVLALTSTSNGSGPDEDAIRDLTEKHVWADGTLDALFAATSSREAARNAGVHHSTMAKRLEIISDRLGYLPMDGIGRARFTLAFLKYKLSKSQVFELPTL